MPNQEDDKPEAKKDEPEEQLPAKEELSPEALRRLRARLIRKYH